MKKDAILRANYHTHTKRCHHACGEDREYVEAAIESGLEILGFSDHTPYPVNPGFQSGMRMSLRDADGYFSSLEQLREEYKKEIQIYIGVEAEYFPNYFHNLISFMKDYPLDYMILGEHFLPDEETGAYVGAPFEEKEVLDRYVQYVIEGMQTGCFSYVAHPDLPNYVGKDSQLCRQQAIDEICREAKRLSIPLEINVLGHKRGIQYPSMELINSAAKYENDVIIGMDVHNPQHFFDTKEIMDCVEMTEKYGLHRIETLSLGRRG